jgi:hypothetical protein
MSNDTTTTAPFDHIGFIIDFESGELGAEELINGFQQLINSGLAWQLLGCYGRTATALINAGHCTAAAK